MKGSPTRLILSEVSASVCGILHGGVLKSEPILHLTRLKSKRRINHVPYVDHQKAPVFS